MPAFVAGALEVAPPRRSGLISQPSAGAEAGEGPGG